MITAYSFNTAGLGTVPLVSLNCVLFTTAPEEEEEEDDV